MPTTLLLAHPDLKTQRYLCFNRLNTKDEKTQTTEILEYSFKTDFNPLFFVARKYEIFMHIKIWIE